MILSTLPGAGHQDQIPASPAILSCCKSNLQLSSRLLPKPHQKEVARRMSRLRHPSTNSLITLEDLVVWLEEFLLNECLLYACHCTGWKEPLLSFTASYSACLLKLSAQQNRLTVHTEETITANGLQVPAFLLEPVNKCKQGHTSSCDAFRGAVRRGTPTDHHGQRGGSLLSTSVRSLTLIH